MTNRAGGEPVEGGRRLVVVGLVVLGVGGALVLKRPPPEPLPGMDVPRPILASAPADPVPESYGPSRPGLPRLVAVGAGECIPCRAMAPIRAELRREYADALVLDFYDVWKDPAAGRHFSVRGIPTLIYYDAAGRELGRQLGYVPKETILETLAALGMPLPRPGA